MRAPFFNGWLIWTSSILALCLIAPILMNDLVTWAAWGFSFAVAYGARSYQYFIQHR